MDLRLQLVKDIAADKITDTGHVIMRFPSAKIRVDGPEIESR